MRPVINFFFTIFLIQCLSFCTSPQNEIIEWGNSIPSNINIEELKNLKCPSSFTIDWDRPEKLQNKRTRYYLIVNSDEILEMDYYIEFKNNVYIGLFPHK